MTNRQIIRQLKDLGSNVNPDKKWVFSTKQRILGKEEIQAERIPSFVFLRNPALALTSLVVFAVIAVGLFFFLGSGTNTSRLSQLLPQYSAQNSEKNILNSLDKLQASLDNINRSLDTLKKAKDASRALAMTEVVKATTQAGERIVKKIKDSQSPLSKKVLTSLDNIAMSSKNISQKSENISKSLLLASINDLKERSLTPENEARLQKAEEYYNEGQLEQAMVLVLMIK